jgi:NADPH2:quinone reductase
MNAAHNMNVIAIRGGAGPASALHLVQAPLPQPAPGQLLVRVLAAGVNRPDLLQREGNYPPPPGAPDVLGLEIAGSVVRGAGRWREGDAVCALLGGGGYAEFAVLDARHALPVPAGLSAIEAAALPETVFTVYANVFEHGADKAAQARALGADIAVDTTREDFGALAQDAGGVDVALDMVGAAYFAATLQALNVGGRIVYIAALGGGTLEVPVWQLMRKRALLTGSTLRPRSADEKARLAAEIERVVWPWIEQGKVRAIVDRTFPLAQAAAAHAHLESGAHVGKVVLTV